MFEVAESLRLVKTGRQLANEIDRITRNSQLLGGFDLGVTCYDYPITVILSGPLFVFQVRIGLFQDSQPMLVAKLEHENGKIIGDPIRAYDISTLFDLVRSQLEYISDAATNLRSAMIDRSAR